MTDGPSRGAIGGAADEAGGEYRRAVAAYFVAHGLNGAPISPRGLPLVACVARGVRLETDEAVDDIAVDLVPPFRLLVQAKRRLTRAAFRATVRQWVAAVRREGFDRRHERLILVSGRLPQWAVTLGRVLDMERGTERGARTASEQEAIDVLDAELVDATEEERAAIKAVAVIETLFVEDESLEHSERARLLLDGRVVEAGEGLAAWRELIRVAGVFARGRAGGDMDVWRNALRTSSVTLTGRANEYLPTNVVPRSLPPGPLRFVNRQRELQRLTDLLERAHGAAGPTVALVSGMPGVGKTSIGKQWAVLNRHHFDGGDLFVDLSERRSAPARPVHDRNAEGSGVDVGEVLGMFLRKLGVSEWALPIGTGERANLFHSLTAFKRLLVFIDDAVYPSEVVSLLPAGPGSMVIVTAKRRFGELVHEGARPVEVSPLDDPAAVDLLADVVGEEVDPGSPVVEKLVELCGGLPIALLVGGQLMAGPGRDLSTFLQRLTNPRGSKPGVARGDSLDRVFDVAYQDLDPEAALMYRRLGSHPGRNAAARDVAALAGTTLEAAERGLAALHERYLVELLGGGRWQMHSRVHAHARACASELDSRDETAAALRRLVDFYYASARAADRALIPDRMRIAEDEEVASCVEPDIASADAAINWFDAERPNILAVLDLARMHEWGDRVWPTVEALWNFYSTRRPFADWVRSHEIGLASAQSAGSNEGIAQMHKQLVRAYVDQEMFDRAEEHLRLAAAAAKASGHPRLIASVAEFTGILEAGRGRFDEAAAAFERARAMFRDAGFERGVALQDWLAAAADVRAGKHEKAVAPLRSAMEFMEKAPDEVSAARIRLRLAEALFLSGEVSAAERNATAAVAAAERLRLEVEQAEGLELLARVSRYAGRSEETYEHWFAAREIYTRIGHPRAAFVSVVLLNLKRGLPPPL